MDGLLRDLRLTFRLLARQPGFTALVILTLALGIGINAAIFSVFNAVVLRPLPFPDSENLVQIKKDLPRFGPNPLVPLEEFRRWQEENRTLSQLEAYDWEMGNLSGGAEAERIGFARISGGFFRMLQVQPVRGRDFLPEEDRPGVEPAALLGEGLWRGRFGGDERVLGKSVTLDGRIYSVVGIIPAAFQLPGRYGERIDLWTTLASAGPQGKYGGRLLVQVVARLNPGASLAGAAADLDRISSAATKGRSRGKALPVIWQQEVIGDITPRLLVFLGAVTFVMLIACANVANLLLSRAAYREKEMSVRAALGGGRSRILRQLLTENMALALLGALAGLVLAFWAKNLLHRAIAPGMVHIRSIPIDSSVLGFTAALALVTGLLFGLAPALRTSRTELSESLKAGGRSSRGTRGHRLSNILVAAEISIALFLLTGAGLLLRSLLLVERVDPGFRLAGTLCMTMDLTPAKYPRPQDQAEYFRRVLERVRMLPGIQSAALSACVPLGQFGMSMSGIEIEGRSPEDPEAQQQIFYNVVSPEYCRTLSIPLISGRYFTESDVEGALPVAIVSESFARTYFPKESPLGRQIKTPFEEQEWLTIVGVVGDVRQEGLERRAPPFVCRCYLQAGTQFMALVVRTDGDPMKMAPAVRGQVMSVDRDQPAFGISTLEKMLEGTLESRKTNLALLGTFSLFALVLASVGTYGVVAYRVSRETHEIGIRMALGARPVGVIGMIVRRTMIHALTGVLAGLAAAGTVTRFISGMLYGVGATDPATFVTTALLLTGVAFIASIIPSLRAARVDPMEALRDE